MTERSYESRTARTRAEREAAGTMAALKLDYSVLDAPQRATDRIEADWCASARATRGHRRSLSDLTQTRRSSLLRRSPSSLA